MNTPSVEQPRLPCANAWRARNARAPLAILVAASIVAASFPRAAHADVALPPPPPKKTSSGTPSLPPPPPPPPKKKSGTDAPAKAPEGGRDSASRGSSGATRSPERTTAIVLLATGGIVAASGTTMLLVGGGLRPDGKKSGRDTGLLAAGVVTTAVGLAVATIGLVLLLRSNDGRMPPLRSLAEGHPAVRTPAWQTFRQAEAAPTPYGSTFSLSLASGTF